MGLPNLIAHLRQPGELQRKASVRHTRGLMGVSKAEVKTYEIIG